MGIHIWVGADSKAARLAHQFISLSPQLSVPFVPVINGSILRDGCLSLTNVFRALNMKERHYG